MYKYRKPDTWLDKIDLNIMPYVDAPEWENRYPTISALLMSNANKRELQRISAGLQQHCHAWQRLCVPIIMAQCPLICLI